MIESQTKVSVYGYGEGKVLRQRGKMVFVELTDGMEVCVEEGECSPIMEAGEVAKMFDSLKQTKSPKGGSHGMKKGPFAGGKSRTIEVDLHFEKLLKQRLCKEVDVPIEVQMEVFRRTMSANISHKGWNIVFIHGKGDGTLRQNIILELKSKWPLCKWEDGKYCEYGVGGAVKVRIG